jgi:hypothetical protein
MGQKSPQPCEVGGGNGEQQPLAGPLRQRRVDRGIGRLDLGGIDAQDPDRDRTGRREEIGGGQKLNQSPLPSVRMV